VTSPAEPDVSPPALALPAASGPYPAVGQPGTTTAGIRAAADLIDRSGITGLSVTCADDRISIQVTAGSGDAQARAATVARLAACLGSTAVQEDSPAEGRSWIRANGSAAGLPVEVFTTLTVQEIVGCRGGLLAVAPNGRIVAAVPPERLPRGWRWLTDLDTAATAASSGDDPGTAAPGRPPADVARRNAPAAPKAAAGEDQAS
jgi:hypothetical protein